MLRYTTFKLNVNLLGIVNLKDKRSITNKRFSTIVTTTIIAVSLFSAATLLSLQDSVLAAGNMSKAGGAAAAGNMSKAGGAAAAGNMSKAGGAAGNTSAKVITNASKVVGSGLKGLGNAVGAGLKGLGNLISPGKK